MACPPFRDQYAHRKLPLTLPIWLLNSHLNLLQFCTLKLCTFGLFFCPYVESVLWSDSPSFFFMYPWKRKGSLATGITWSQVMYSGASSCYLHVSPQIPNSSHLCYSWNSFLTQLQYNWCIFPRSVMYVLGKTMNRTILYRHTVSCKGSSTE